MKEITVTLNYKNYSPDILSSYDYSEPYDKNKKYKTHIANYGHGMRRLELYLKLMLNYTLYFKGISY